MFAPVPLLTERLMLRPLVATDAPILAQLAADPSVSAMIPRIPHPYTLDDAATYIDLMHLEAQSGSNYAYAVTRRQDGILMGTAEIGVEQHHQRGALGYWMGAPYRQQGYTREAVSRLIQLGFGELDLHRVYAYCLRENAASAQVLERCGLKREGILHDHIFHQGRFHDEVYYALLRTDYSP
jgi:[ribosomal protein S5]-alanine N-acetyltransferase